MQMRFDACVLGERSREVGWPATGSGVEWSGVGKAVGSDATKGCEGCEV